MSDLIVSSFVCTTPDSGSLSVKMEVAGQYDSCRQRAKRERRKLREAQTSSEQESLPDPLEE